MPESNKNRLYIAYYRRGARETDSVKYHTALLLVPKNPKDTSANESWRFHVKNVLEGGKQVWEYNGGKTRNRTVQLMALLFLGKVGGNNTGEVLQKLLDKVKVVQDDEGWRCRHWAWDAIQALIDYQVILPLEGGAAPQVVWEKGYVFADGMAYDGSKPLPTCDQKGKPITSEIK